MKKVTISYCISNYLEEACRKVIISLLELINTKSTVIEIETLQEGENE